MKNDRTLMKNCLFSHKLSSSGRMFQNSLIYLPILLQFFSYRLNAQQQIPDSLKKQIIKSRNTIEQFSALHNTVNYFIEINNLDGIQETAPKELEIAQQLRNDSMVGIAYTDLGIYFGGKSDF